MQSLPDYREIETTISLANIKDQVAALLYASGMVHDNEEVLDIIFDFTDGYEGWNGNYPIKIKLKKQQQVEVLTY